MEQRIEKIRKNFSKRYVLHCGDINELKLPLTAVSIDPGSSMMGVRIEKVLDKYNSECILDRVINIGGKNLGSKCESIPYTLACILDELYDWSVCSLVIIEKQVGMNKDMIVIENVIATYFMMLWSESVEKCVVSISNSVKSCFFDNSKDRKRLSLHIARKICERRGDTKSLDNWKNIKSIKEGSDRGDPVLQLHIFLYCIDLTANITL